MNTRRSINGRNTTAHKPESPFKSKQQSRREREGNLDNGVFILLLIFTYALNFLFFFNLFRNLSRSLFFFWSILLIFFVLLLFLFYFILHNNFYQSFFLRVAERSKKNGIVCWKIEDVLWKVAFWCLIFSGLCTFSSLSPAFSLSNLCTISFCIFVTQKSPPRNIQRITFLY